MKLTKSLIDRLASSMVALSLLTVLLTAGQANADTCEATENEDVCNGMVGCKWTGTACVVAPEMSDYLAMTFVAASFGAVLYIRRRSLGAV